MKTKVVAVIMVLALFQIAFAGGILTNTNQSVQFVRMLARNASTQIDAVYFNPAGMTQLSDGFFLAFYSQTISKTRTITNSLAILNTNEYKGDIFVPVFPNFYAVYKKGKFAAAFGFEPVAGGGTADFKKGLPDLEMMALKIVAAMGISTVDLDFKGSSVYYGFQTGIAYALTDQFSASVGVRYNMAKNTYEGSIKNVMV
ncbi:aromatic hydrocarbon degradation protein, partial [candidate division KSB1 bacterium]